MTGLGVIGLGAVSGEHLAGYADVTDVAVVAVCDTVSSRLESAPAGAERFDDWRALIASSRVDAVVVLLPHDLHHPVAAAALDAGKHVCVEKPLALSAAECSDLLMRARRSGRMLVVAENARYVPAYELAARELEQLGRVRLVRSFVYGSAVANYGRPDAGWKIRPGGIAAVIDAAVHSFYLLAWLIGPVTAVQASTRHWVRDNLLPTVAVEDGALVSGTLQAGGHFTCEVCLSAELPWGERLEIYGEHGSLIADSLSPTPLRVHRGADDVRGEISDQVSAQGWGQSIRAAARDFAEAVRDGRQPAVAVEDAVYAVELAGCAYRSAAAHGRPVHPGGDG